MKQFASVAIILCFLIASSSLFAQNALITIENPDDLYVCGEDILTVNVKNTGTGTLNNIIATVALPAAIQYVTGTVTGAVEQNITDLSAPKFSIASLGAGAEQQFKLTVVALCDLVPLINSGQLFTNKVTVTYTGGMDMINSTNYKVETGLVVISSASPITTAAEIGDMPIRTYKIKNTRLGPIKRLLFYDNHFPGFTATISGTNEINNPVLFSGELDGSFFTSFGDGDNLFEFNEEITITEKLTVTDCGTPSFDNPSRIRVGWGCNTDLCQYDSTDLELTILPSTKNPDLKFSTTYGYPVDYCVGTPSTNIVTIVNSGSVDATNVILDFYNGIFDFFTGMDPASFEYNNGQGWTPIAPSVSSPITLGACNVDYLSRSLITVPLVPANATTLLRYKFFTCFPDCDQALIPPYFFTFYEKSCPEGANASDSIGFVIDSALLSIRHLTRFNIKECLVEGETYDLNFTARSARFLTDTTYFQARFNLPKGIYWDSTCVTPTIDGKSPIYTSSVVDPTTGTTSIVLTFDLPFNSDSVNLPFCLKFICFPDIPCMDVLGEIGQEGGNSTAFPVMCENACGLKTLTQAAITNTPDAGPGCGLTACHLFMLITDAPCATGAGGGGGSGIPAGLLVEYKTYRTNYGLQDEDDNRIADSALKPDLSQIRLDRYMPGDTLRFELKGVVLFGQVPDFPLQINTESLQSDFGKLDGDAYNLVTGRLRLVNRDSLFLIRSHLRVKRADGTEYECDAPLVDYKHQNYIQMQAVNIQPPQTLDRFLTMYRTFGLGMATCAPDGQGPTVGDSVFYVYEYQFRQNYAPARAGGQPPALINIRNVPWDRDFAWTYPDSIGWPRPMSQYSGYVQSRSYPKNTIRPCATSLQTTPFAYGIRLARGNMFPFEVRQIAEISDFNYRLAPDVNILSALTDLTLQESVPWFNAEPIPWSNVGLDYKFDYAGGIFELPIDEGFSLRTDFVFDESCSFLGPDTAQVKFDITYPEPFPNSTVITYQRRDGTGFLDAAPRLKADFNSTILNMSSSNFEIDFVLKNLRPHEAPNTWMYVEPLNGTISDVEILALPAVTPYPGLANLFQLGTVTNFAQQGLRIKGKNSNCEGLKLRLIFGWDCDLVGNPFASTCGRDTVVLDLRLSNAVLELDIINQPPDVPLCEPSDYFTFEVSNANDGNGLGITSSVKLPPGLTIVPGSSQIQYPSPSGTWTNIVNPGTEPGNIYLWKIEDILPALTNGLPGFPEEPNNAFRIRFRVIAECGFVANAQPIYGVDGIQPCGSFTNSLRKPDEPINLEGVNPAYGVDINLSPTSTSVSCGEDFEIAVQLLLQGTPAPNDSIYFTLPTGVSYVAGSYQPVQNAPAGTPLQVGQTLQWGYNSGLSSGSVVKFNIKVKYSNAAGCLDKFIIAQTRQKTEGFCATINQACGVYIATGEALLQIPSVNPDLKLSSFTPGAVSTGGGFNFEAVLENPGMVAAENAVLQLWIDANGNGKPDPGEQLLKTLNYNQTIAPGATATQGGNLNIPLEDLCKLLAVLPADENCACAPKYFPIDGLVVNQGTFARCAVEPVTIGVMNTTGHFYTWQPTTLLSCNACPETTFTPDANVQNGDFFTFVLFETAGTCTIEHRFEIRYGEALGINTPDQLVCKGDSVILQASPGGTYQWTGPGVNPTAQQQILFPTSSATYSVTVTLSAGCTGTDVVKVDVLEPSNIVLPTIKTCPGKPPVTIFGEPQTDAGTYCKTFQKANGCDSTVCVTLIVAPVAGNSVLTTCAGDSVEVFSGQFETAQGEYCKTFTNSAGCDSTHCVNLTVVPKVPTTPLFTTTIEKGSSVQLQGPAGFASYAWTPNYKLDCTDCQNPTASPDTSTTYTVRVTNAGGCTGEAVYRILVAPPCFENVLVPNAFTPNNDTINNYLQVILNEGQFEKVVRLQVYNRWGQRIFDATDDPRWDGNVGGKPAPMDVYIFIFDIECNGKTKRLLEREVTLIR